VRRVALAATLLAGGCQAEAVIEAPHEPPHSASSTATMADPGAAPGTMPTAARSLPTAGPSSERSEGPCPADMVDLGTRCIDRYEAPNVKGEKPLRMQSAEDGEAFCKRSGKRLCSEDDWLRACNGKSQRAFPYGDSYRAGVCNDDGKYLAPSWKALASWPGATAVAEANRLDQSEPSGTRDGCVSEEGVADLTGNVAEWVVRTRDNETNYGHVVKGCFWGRCYRPPHTPSCAYVNFAHASGFRSYELGFRCCADRKRE
jgi:hypothetical protein